MAYWLLLGDSPTPCLDQTTSSKSKHTIGSSEWWLTNGSVFTVTRHTVPPIDLPNPTLSGGTPVEVNISPLSLLARIIIKDGKFYVRQKRALAFLAQFIISG